MKRKFIMIIAVIAALLLVTLALTSCGGGEFEMVVLNAESSSTLPSVSWSAVDKAEFYELSISTDKNFSSLDVHQAPIRATSYQLTEALQNNTKYYTKVEAFGDGVYKIAQTTFTTAQFNRFNPKNYAVDTTIFDFNYASQQELTNRWSVHGGGDKIDLTLVNSPLENGGKAMKFVYDNQTPIISDGVQVQTQGWCQSYTKVDNDKYVWDLREGIKFFVKTEGDGTSLRFSIVERSGGDYFYFDVELKTAYEGFISVPFSELIHDKDNSWGDGYLQKHAIKQVQISAVGFTKGEFIIDELSIVKECTDNRDVVQDTSEDPRYTPAENYEDFESYNLGEVTEFTNGAWKTENVEPIIIEGLNGKCLSVPKSATSLILEPTQNNWTAYKGMSFKAKATEKNTVVYVQIKDTYENYSELIASISLSPKTIKFDFTELQPLSGKEVKADLSSISFFKLYISTNYDEGNILIDDITFTKEGFDKEEGVIVYEDFTDYTTTAELQQVWTGSPELVDYLGEPAMKIAAQTALVMNETAVSLDNCNAIRITYWTLQSYNIGIYMYVSGYGDYAGEVKLQAASDTNYAVTVLHVPGGQGRAPWNVQLKDFASDCYISKVEFIYDDNPPEIKFSATSDSITFNPITDCEYSIDDGATWSDSNVFEGLTPNTTYRLAIRYKATETFVASKIAKDEVTLSTIALGAPFTDGCVLQREKQISIWGNAAANASLTLTFNNQTKTTTASEEGKFVFTLDAMQANSVGQVLSVTDGQTTFSISNVLVGEVWIVAGQSNIQMTLATTDFTAEDIAQSNLGLIRLFKQEMATAETPQFRLNGGWVVADSAEAVSFSALGYMFGANLYKELNVPVGIIYAAQGATDIEAWISSDSYNGANETASLNYNAMIQPIAGYGAKGVMWYQGENNSGRAHQYADLLKMLFSDWRMQFDNPDLYFLAIQLPIYTSPSINWAYLREAQEKGVIGDENADLIVTIDGGDLNDIHPTQKRYIALRCVEMACYKLYGGEPFAFSYITNVDMVDNTFTLTVSNATSLWAEGQVTGFEVGNAEGDYFPASATIDGNKIYVVSAIEDGIYVRYNFHTEAGGNVFDNNNLPLAPFRSDNLNIALKTDFSGNIEGDQVVGLETYEAELSVIDSLTGKAIKITPTMANGQASLAIGGNWKGFRYIKVVFKVSANYDVLTLALSTATSYPYRNLTGNGEWQTAIIDLYTFQGQDMEAWDGTVQYLIFKLPAFDSWAAIDSVQVIETAEPIEPMPNLEDRVVDDFSYADKQALNAVWAEYQVTSSVADGKLVLSTNVAGSQISRDIGQSWTGYKSLEITFNAEAGVEFEIVFNINWNSYSGIKVTSIGGDQIVVLNFEDFSDGQSIQTGTIQQLMIKPTQGATVTVDQIKLIAPIK